MGKLGVQTCRDMVKSYCAEHKMKQSDFGAMLGVSKSSFGRFMGAGKETTGKGSECFNTLNSFFQKQKREEKKASEARHIAQVQQLAVAAPALGDVCNEAGAKPVLAESDKDQKKEDADDNVEGGDDGHRQKKAKLDHTEE
jgi:hypothetical protein